MRAHRHARTHGHAHSRDERNIIYIYACACTHTHTHMHVCMWPLVFLHPSSTRSLVPHAQLLQHVRCRLGFVSAGHSSMNSLTRSLRKLALHHPWARTLSRMRMSREGWVACFRFSGGPDLLKLRAQSSGGEFWSSEQ